MISEGSRRRRDKVKLRLGAWQPETSPAAKKVAELFPENFVLPALIKLVDIVLHRIGDPNLHMDSIDKRTTATVFCFMDRSWDVVGPELCHWYAADPERHRLYPR
jgi:hypothetical protein